MPTNLDARQLHLAGLTKQVDEHRYGVNKGNDVIAGATIDLGPDTARTVQALEMYSRQVTDFALLHAGRASSTVIWRRKGGPIDNQGASHGRIMD